MILDLLQSLRLAPFHLNDAAIEWVSARLAELSLEDQLRQLFVHLTIGDDEGHITDYMRHQPGGVHRFLGDDFEAAWRGTDLALGMSQLPLLVTGDLEAGGNSPASMTRFPSQLAVAAADNPALGAQMVAELAHEARALGFNWSFTPVVDIARNVQSAVVGSRSYGSDVDRIIDNAVAHIRTIQAAGIAATAKHWPGEGTDQRDQHLVTTVNPLSVEDWNQSYGRIWRAVIDAGVMTIMSAHIALPAWAEKLDVPEGRDRYQPASQSAALNLGLLRGELGFNGLIVSDATEMAGLSGWAGRKDAIPQVIASGCDMILFSANVPADLSFLRQAIESGVLTLARVKEAVTRILGLKAALGLHNLPREDRLPPLEKARAMVHCPEAKAVSAAIAERSVTLVKDVRGTLPIDPVRHRRIIVIDGHTAAHPLSGPPRPLQTTLDALQERGFETRFFDPADPPRPETTDLVMYLFGTESALIQSRIFIDWNRLHHGFPAVMERYWNDIPTIMVSLGHPYYLFDAPGVPTYLNAYSTVEASQLAMVQVLTGELPAQGYSPVDAFCGMEDARY